MTDDLYPVFELLETRLEQGYYFSKQGNRWWLFDPAGEGHCSGRTIRELLTNLIFVDC
jgi:hypothetical protein